MAAFSQSLNFADLKRRTMASRVSKVNIAPQNGAVFAPGGNIQISLPTMSSSYACLDQAYLKFKVKSVGAAAHLDHSAYSLISRVDTTSSSAVIDSCQNYGVYMSYLLDSGMGAASAKDWGKTCLLMGGDDENTHVGAPLLVDATKTACLPFMTGLFNSNKQIPLDTGAPLTFTFFLQDAANALISTANAAQATGYVITDVEFCVYVTTLSADSQALLDQSVGELGYNVIFEATSNTSAHKAADERQVISNLGFRYSALSRVSVIHRVAANQGSFKQLSISNRSHANLAEASLSLGGLSVPERPLRMAPGDKAEVLTETLISWGVLGSQDHQLGFNGMTRNAGGTEGTHIDRYDIEDGKFADNKDATFAKTYAAPNGSFGFSIDTDLIKSGNGDSGGIYSGTSTLATTTQSRLTYSADSSSAQTIDYFANYTCILSMDSVSRGFMVSV